MERVLLSAPPAFAAGCRALSLFSSAELADALQQQAASGSAAAASPVALGAAQLVLRAAERLHPTATALRSALLAHTDLSVAAAEALAAAADARGSCAADASAPPPPPPPPRGAPCTALESASWALTVGHRSSACAALAAPSLVLDLRLRRASEPPRAGDAPAQLWHERLELTPGQLAFLEASVRAAVDALERA